jgi:DNA polymerase delta subunit 1
MSIEVFPVDWIARDLGKDDDAQYCVSVFGKTPDGRSACVHIEFYPYFFVGLPPAWQQGRQRLWLQEAVTRHRASDQHSRLVSRVPMWGFTGGAQRPFALLAFRTLRAFSGARYRFGRDREQRMPTYEASVDPVVRLFHVRDIKPARWIAAQRCVPVRDRLTTCDVEVRCVFCNVGPATRVDRPPLVIASWDIECYSQSGRFPLADNPDDKVIQIATAFQRYGEDQPYLRTVVALGPTDAVEGAEVLTADTEPDVITRWTRLLRRERADVMLGYNTHQFDWKYVYGRAQVCVDDDTGEPLVDLSALGRVVPPAAQDEDDDARPKRGGDAAADPGAVHEWELNSGAYGQNKFFVLRTPGVLQIDLLQYVRREFKLASFSLNAVSEHFLGDKKLDLPAAQIFAKFRGSSADRADIARYAVKDTELPLRLLRRLSVLENLLEMANAGKRGGQVGWWVGFWAGRSTAEQHDHGAAALLCGGADPGPDGALGGPAGGGLPGGGLAGGGLPGLAAG